MTIDAQHGDEIAARYKKGESISQIATAMEVSDGSVQRVLKLRMIPVRARGVAYLEEIDD